MPTDTVPPNVASLAAQRGLGRLVAARGAASRPSHAGWFLAAAIAALGLGVLLYWASMATETRSLGFASLAFLCALFPVLLIWSVRMLVRGVQSYFLYEGGLVRTKNGRPRLVPWPAVTELVRQRAGEKAAEYARLSPGMQMVTADTVTGYRLRSPVGSFRIEVGSVAADDYAPFCANLERLASHGGARITG